MRKALLKFAAFERGEIVIEARGKPLARRRPDERVGASLDGRGRVTSAEIKHFRFWTF
jgi:hypothetical protein